MDVRFEDESVWLPFLKCNAICGPSHDDRRTFVNWQSALTVLALTLAIGTNVSAQQVAQPDVVAFIRGQAIHGGSYRELSTLYDSTAVPILIDALNSDAEEGNRGRVARLLGILGDERAVGAMIAFIEKGRSELISRADHRARRSALRSLGYLINRTGSERALKYLIEGLTPSVWRERNVTGVVSYVDSSAKYDMLLSTYAILGLAQSGHPRAGEALKTLLQSPTPEQRDFRDAEEATVTQWLEVHGLVAERGVAGMYEYYETQRRLKFEEELEEVQRLREAQQTRR